MWMWGTESSVVSMLDTGGASGRSVGLWGWRTVCLEETGVVLPQMVSYGLIFCVIPTL